MNYVTIEPAGANKWNLIGNGISMVVVRRYGSEDWEVWANGRVIKKYEFHNFQEALNFAYDFAMGDEE